MKKRSAGPLAAVTTQSSGAQDGCAGTCEGRCPLSLPRFRLSYRLGFFFSCKLHGHYLCCTAVKFFAACNCVCMCISCTRVLVLPRSRQRLCAGPGDGRMWLLRAQCSCRFVTLFPCSASPALCLNAVSPLVAAGRPVSPGTHCH